jgi:hypothetical protein
MKPGRRYDFDVPADGSPEVEAMTEAKHPRTDGRLRQHPDTTMGPTVTQA